MKFKDINDAEREELTARYEKVIGIGELSPAYLSTDLEVFLELSRRYPMIKTVRQVFGLSKQNEIIVVNLAVDEQGAICGPGINNTNPCPPDC